MEEAEEEVEHEGMNVKNRVDFLYPWTDNEIKRLGKGESIQKPIEKKKIEITDGQTD